MALKKKVITAIILIADKFEDMEVFFPYFRLLEEGVDVEIVAPEKGDIHGEHGYTISVEKTFDEINPDEYDLLIIPGRFPDGAPRTVSRNLKAIEITKAFFAKNKPVASICHGHYTLVSADVIKGRHLTSFWHDDVPKEIKKAGGKWEDNEVVVNNNLITSR